MSKSSAEATWNGTLEGGSGSMKLGSGLCEVAFSFGTRFQSEPGTNPEELLGAAHAGCFSMAFSKMLEDEGHAPNRVHTQAEVTLDNVDGGFAITHIALTMEADVPGIDDDAFQKIAQQAKQGCPVSKLFKGAQIEMNAKLL